ncbi:hypothetical protein DSCOOX_26050 [Desulfosarcina ovata subsp. ovata]|uniref:Uncharacterized protein n=1 Tax=Desulfosarcina ovata subsp. ovata TaxID=2752305 RepID=A0A5K8AA15_9BACT|nr:hypothetical protein DSCOOX_26050 [Desulfosarcina ovata subsp. ovata]
MHTTQTDEKKLKTFYHIVIEASQLFDNDQIQIGLHIDKGFYSYNRPEVRKTDQT